MRLENKIAVITGASRGIGEEIAKAYAREGAKLVLASRKQEGLDAVAAEIRKDIPGATVLTVATHTGDPNQCKALIDRTVQEFGRVDILVNNAATNPHFGPILTSEPSHWQKIFEVNLFGYFWMAKYAAESMQKTGGGKIINMSSIAGIQPGPMMGVYSCSKAAVIMMTKVMAQELGADNIQVNSIAPGFIKTRFSEAIWGNDQIMKRLEENTPAGRMGEPDELAGAAVYLASQESNFMTGHTLLIDGGLGITSV